VSFLRRLLRGSEPEHHHSSDPVPGWDAINAALEPTYGEVEPLHWGTVKRWRNGGPDPLDGISAYRVDGPPPHWHFVSYGLSELYRKESEDPEVSGWGIELTFRLGREVELRFDPRDAAARPRVFVANRFVCDTVPLDRVRNASRRRRRVHGDATPAAEPSGLDPLALIEAEHYDRVRPVGAPPRAPGAAATPEANPTPQE
jgi:hypothetical protein